MKFWDLATYSFSHLKHRGLRTWLTLLGIVVGIAAVILLVGIAQGLHDSVNEELKMFGSDILIITPGSTSGGAASSATPTALRSTVGKLFEQDVDVVRKVEGVEVVSKIISTTAPIKYEKEDISSSVMGVDTSTYLDTASLYEIDEGRFIEEGDRKVVLLGGKIAAEGFDEEIRLNSILEIAGENYRVVGILEETGSTYSSVDSLVVIPFEDAQNIAGDSLAEREVSMIRVKVSPGYDTSEVEENTDWALMQHRKVTEDDKDFTIISAQYIQGQVDSILGALTLFLAAVSGISLVVGAIGIMNTMFMSVLERTREIGVLKSIGATEAQIERVFLMEASMIGIAGGVCGMVAGALLLVVVSLLGLNTSFSLEMALFAFIFSAAVGIIAGTFPAKQAAKVPAVEALRYE